MPNEGEVLANIDFTYPFAGKDYLLKRANIKQVIDWQRKSVEINKQNDGAADLASVAYALYISLHAADATITEEYVMENCPGDIDVILTLGLLGFMSQQKVEILRPKARNSLASTKTDLQSGPISSAA